MSREIEQNSNSAPLHYHFGLHILFKGTLAVTDEGGRVRLFVFLTIIITATGRILISHVIITFSSLHAFYIKTFKLKVSIAETF